MSSPFLLKFRLRVEDAIRYQLLLSGITQERRFLFGALAGQVDSILTNTSMFAVLCGAAQRRCWSRSRLRFWYGPEYSRSTTSKVRKLVFPARTQFQRVRYQFVVHRERLEDLSVLLTGCFKSQISLDLHCWIILEELQERAFTRLNVGFM